MIIRHFKLDLTNKTEYNMIVLAQNAGCCSSVAEHFIGNEEVGGPTPLNSFHEKEYRKVVSVTTFRYSFYESVFFMKSLKPYCESAAMHYQSIWHFFSILPQSEDNPFLLNKDLIPAFQMG